jgi:hypothetical protein
MRRYCGRTVSMRTSTAASSVSLSRRAEDPDPKGRLAVLFGLASVNVEDERSFE